ncbi:hypothetical protein ES703_112926 [subsurface metagenome]
MLSRKELPTKKRPARLLCQNRPIRTLERKNPRNLKETRLPAWDRFSLNDSDMGTRSGPMIALVRATMSMVRDEAAMSFVSFKSSLPLSQERCSIAAP